MKFAVFFVLFFISSCVEWRFKMHPDEVDGTQTQSGHLMQRLSVQSSKSKNPQGAKPGDPNIRNDQENKVRKKREYTVKKHTATWMT